jgi:hypothetical protein
VRALTWAHAGWGAALLCAPRVGLGDLTGQPLDRPTRVATCVLGTRLLAQAALTRAGRGSERSRVLGGAGVDALHATSMVLLGWRVPRYRKVALRNAAVAGALAGAGAVSGLLYARGHGPIH